MLDLLSQIIQISLFFPIFDANRDFTSNKPDKASCMRPHKYWVIGLLMFDQLPYKLYAMLMLKIYHHGASLLIVDFMSEDLKISHPWLIFLRAMTMLKKRHTESVNAMNSQIDLM